MPWHFAVLRLVREMVGKMAVRVVEAVHSRRLATHFTVVEAAVGLAAKEGQHP